MTCGAHRAPFAPRAANTARARSQPPLSRAGLGPIPWLLPAEVFGMDERAGASGFAASSNWLANFAAAQMFLPLSTALGGLTFLPFGGVLVVALVLTAIYMPETRGKSLEQIRAEMRS